jgi:hypothetical protein
MGYRSEVAYMVCFRDEEIDGVNKGKEMFYTFLAEAKSKTETANCFLEEGKPFAGFVVDKEKLRFEFYADNAKWYDGYTDVDCHNALVDLAREYVDADNERVEGINGRLRTEFVTKYGHMSYEDIEKQNIQRPNYIGEVVGYSFVRIGEEDSDNDCRWGGWEEAIERCSMSRSINFDDH